MINAKTACIGFGVTFLLAGIAGFVPNPIVSPDGIFVVDTMHNLLHILTGAAFLAGFALAVLGFLTSGNMLLGMVHINQADRWLHVFLAAGIVATGFGLLRAPAERT